MLRIATHCALLAGLLWPAAVPAAEPWIAVVMPGSAKQVPEPDDVQLIFERKKIYDVDGGLLLPVNLPADAPLRKRFSRAVLRKTPESMEAYWNQMYFQGIVPPHVIESEAGVQRFVSQTPHAIGYIQACLADANFRIVLLIDPDGNLQPATANPGCASSSP